MQLSFVMFKCLISLSVQSLLIPQIFFLPTSDCFRSFSICFKITSANNLEGEKRLKHSALQTAEQFLFTGRLLISCV